MSLNVSAPDVFLDYDGEGSIDLIAGPTKVADGGSETAMLGSKIAVASVDPLAKRLIGKSHHVTLIAATVFDLPKAPI
jgi:hypothetical protein